MEIVSFTLPLIFLALVLHLNPPKEGDASEFPFRKIMSGATISWAIGIVLLYKYFSENYTVDGWPTEFVCSLLFLFAAVLLGAFLSWLMHKRGEEAKSKNATTPEMIFGASLGSFFKTYLRAFKFTFIFNLLILIVSCKFKNAAIFNTIYYGYDTAPISLLLIVSLLMAIPIAIFLIQKGSLHDNK